MIMKALTMQAGEAHNENVQSGCHLKYIGQSDLIFSKPIQGTQMHLCVTCKTSLMRCVLKRTTHTRCRMMMTTHDGHFIIT